MSFFSSNFCCVSKILDLSIYIHILEHPDIPDFSLTYPIYPIIPQLPPPPPPIISRFSQSILTKYTYFENTQFYQLFSICFNSPSIHSFIPSLTLYLLLTSDYPLL